MCVSHGIWRGQSKDKMNFEVWGNPPAPQFCSVCGSWLRAFTYVSQLSVKKFSVKWVHIITITSCQGDQYNTSICFTGAHRVVQTLCWEVSALLPFTCCNAYTIYYADINKPFLWPLWSFAKGNCQSRKHNNRAFHFAFFMMITVERSLFLGCGSRNILLLSLFKCIHHTLGADHKKTGKTMWYPTHCSRQLK